MAQKIGFGAELPSKIKDGYSSLLNTYVKVDVAGGSRVGYLETITSTDLYLRPSLVDESLTELVVRRIESERPMPIPLSSIIDIQPIREGYLEEVLKDIKKYNKELRIKKRREQTETRVREMENRMKLDALKDYKKSKENQFVDLTQLD